MNTTTKKDPTATEQYATEQKQIKALLKIIENRLAKHAAAQTMNPGNWGYTGDLTTITDRLQDVADFLLIGETR